MHPSTWINGQHQQVGAASQVATRHTIMRNQQSGSVTDSCPYRTVNMRVQPSQSANVTFWYGTNTGHMSNCQTSVAPHQTASLLQPTRGENSRYFTLQNLAINTQSGNTCLPFSNRFQVSPRQYFYHNSALNSSTQTPPGMDNANATYPLRDTAAYLNQPVNGAKSISAQDGNTAPGRQHYRVQDTVHQNGNRESMKAISAYSATGSLFLREQAACTGSSISVAAHNRQTVHTQNPRQNGIQDGLYSSFPPTYSEAIRSRRNNGSMANSLSNKQNFQVSSLNQKTQQHAPWLNTKHKPGGEASSAVNSNTHSRQFEINHFHSNENENPLNYSAEIFRVVQSIEKSYTAESNQTMQPVTVAQTCNSNTIQPLQLHSRQYLPQNVFNSVTSGAHGIVNMPPQQNNGAAVVYVTTADEGCGNSGIKPDRALMNRHLDGSSHAAPPLHPSVSPQKNKAQCFVDSQERPEALTSVKPCDGSSHSSPGRTGARAVAVVQPLSQEIHQSGSKPSSCNTGNQLGECGTTDESCNRNSVDLCSSPDVEKNQQGELGEGINVCTENANQTRSSKLQVEHSAASSDGTLVSSPKSFESHDLLKKLLLEDWTDSELALYMRGDQKVARASQQSVTTEVPVSQNIAKDAREMPTDLASIPTIPWTRDMLTNLIQDEEKSHMLLNDNAKYDSVVERLDMFWDDNRKMLVSKLKKTWYKHLIDYVQEFCGKRVTKDSVVLSQVKHGFGDVLKNYHVLKEKDVYSAPLYKSSWLNVNQQLDDIDKEFCFPWSLKHGLSTFETSSQPDQGILAQTVRNVPTDPLVKPTLETVSPVEEKQTSTLTTSNQTFSPNKTDSADSSDPYYSFEIQVLPPEEAKLIYQQVQSETPQSMDTDSQSEEVTNSSEEDEMDEVTDAALRESILEDESVPPVEEVCCIARLLQTMGGEHLSKCQCKIEENQSDCADKIPNKEAATQKNNKLPLLKSETNVPSVTKGETQVNGGEDTNSHIVCSKPELCSELIIDLTEDDHPHLYVANNQMNISHNSINDTESSISENEDKEMNTAGHSPLRNSDNRGEGTRKISSNEVTSQMSDVEEDCAQAELAPANVVESPLESQKKNMTSALQTTFTLGGERETAERKRKTLSSVDRFFPKLDNSKKCKLSVDQDSKPPSSGVDYKKDFVELPHSKSPATNVRTVELMLFGSAAQEQCVLPSNRRSPVSPLKGSSKAGLMAPRVLAVNVSPSEAKDVVSPGTCSVKQRIHEAWRKSFPPTKIKQKGTLKTIKYTSESFSGVSFKRAETAGSTNLPEPPASSAMRTWKKNAKHARSLKKRRTLSKGVKIRADETKTDAATLRPPADEERSKAGREMCASVPPQERIVLKFSLSPKSCEHRSSGRKESAHPVTDVVPDYKRVKLMRVRDVQPLSRVREEMHGIDAAINTHVA